MKLTTDSARAFARNILIAQNVPADIADDVAEHLVESDRSGYISHGLSILPNYRRALEGQSVNASGRAECVMDRDTVRGRREVYRRVGFGVPEIGATARSSRRVRLPTF